jgi:hypothetical protein
MKSGEIMVTTYLQASSLKLIKYIGKSSVAHYQRPAKGVPISQNILLIGSVVLHWIINGIHASALPMLSKSVWCYTEQNNKVECSRVQCNIRG